MDIISLYGALTRARALEHLLGPSTAQGHDASLLVSASAVESIDVVAATAMRMRIARHQREHPAGPVTIWLPSRTPVAARLYDILRPLPEGVVVGTPPDPAQAGQFTLLPATPIPDSEAATLAGAVVYDRCREVPISGRRTAFIAAAAMELADNAVIHAADAPDPPVIAVSTFGRERLVEVAVTDSGTAIAEARDPQASLAHVPARALHGGSGFLANILRRAAEADVDVVVQMFAGTGRLTWRWNGHRSERGRWVPGLTVVARIGT